MPECSVTVYRGVVDVTYGPLATQTPVGGERAEVTRFSSASRRRLIRAVATAHDAPQLFFTLTYPDEFPSIAESKVHVRRMLQHVIRRLKRVGNDASFVWRMELQKRGAVHYHVLGWLAAYPLDWAPMYGASKDVRDNAQLFIASRGWTEEYTQGCSHSWQGCLTYLSALWVHTVGSEDAAFLNRGVDVTELGEDENASRYVAKYAAKGSTSLVVDQDTGEILPTGRHWGRIGRIASADPYILGWRVLAGPHGRQLDLPALWKDLHAQFAVDCEASGRRRYSVFTDGPSVLRSIDLRPARRMGIR